MDKDEFGRKVLERARSKDNKKNQHDKANPPVAPPVIDPYNPPPVPIDIPPEHLFKILLYFLETEHLPATPGELSALPLLASPKHRRALLTLKEIATKIMKKSGIFYKGGLDAKTRHDPYSIQGLDQFILDLASVLHRHEMGKEYPRGFQSGTFFEVYKRLELYILGVEIWKGKRAAQKLKTILNDLHTLVSETEAKPNLRRPRSIEMLAREWMIDWNVSVKIDYENSTGTRITTKRNIVGIFVKHVKAPGTIIAARAAELLKLFGIEVKSDAIIKMLPKKQPTP